MLLDDVRKVIEATIGNLTPAKAQELAKSFMDPGTAKEQVAKTAADLLDWSQHNRERIREFVDREVQSQMHAVGVASQKDLDAVKKRVRELERAAGMTASGRKKKATSSRKPAARKSAVRKPAASKAAASQPPSDDTPPSSPDAV
jgi:polyhydroxyalkanoate synthesis regulator phasin